MADTAYVVYNLVIVTSREPAFQCNDMGCNLLFVVKTIFATSYLRREAVAPAGEWWLQACSQCVRGTRERRNRVIREEMSGCNPAIRGHEEWLQPSYYLHKPSSPYTHHKVYSRPISYNSIYSHACHTPNDPPLPPPPQPSIPTYLANPRIS